MLKMVPIMAGLTGILSAVLMQDRTAPDRAPRNFGDVVAARTDLRFADLYHANGFNNAPSESVLYTFLSNSDGFTPWSGLIADNNGTLYGTTLTGGAPSGGFGTVYRLVRVGSSYREDVLYSFKGSPDGAGPQGGLVADNSGALYGTTSGGGTRLNGTVFKLTPTKNGFSESILYNFLGSGDGKNPWATLIIDGNGALYGTALNGGAAGKGNVFKLSPSGNSYSESVLYSFQGGNDGASPFDSLLADNAGALYGTTIGGGGSAQLGTVFKLSPHGGGYSESVLYRFKGGADGLAPIGSLIADAGGALYGTASQGGASNVGIVFKLAPTGNRYRESVLFTFHGNDGAGPAASLVADSSGALYSTTVGGGVDNLGTVFKLTPHGTGYDESVMHSFTGGTDGVYPVAPLLLDAAGKLYGTTGGTTNNPPNNGSAFELRPNGNAYRESVIHDFHLVGDGATPQSALIGDPSTALYGTTSNGGTLDQGTVYRLTRSGSGYREKILYRFLGSPDGANPLGGLIADSTGALYGTTSFGGSSNAGAVFKLTPKGNGYNETLLYSFQGGADGANPTASLIADSNGALYGTAYSGGRAAAGTVFKLTPNGGTYTFSVLRTFHGATDGANPEGALLSGASGVLFGTTRSGGASFDGIVFELTPGGTKYTLTILHSFTGGSDGKWPAAGLVTDSTGSLYGTTTGFQGHDQGTVFKLIPSGNSYAYSVLHYFTHRGDGAHPAAAVFEDSSGDLYGTTSGGGAGAGGTVFKLAPSGNTYIESIVYSFQGGSDGAGPVAGLIADSSGAFYSTTSGGGALGVGTVFKLIP
jgi:uncharacterized repeat protein (TIGR03803 family)